MGVSVSRTLPSSPPWTASVPIWRAAVRLLMGMESREHAAAARVEIGFDDADDFGGGRAGDVTDEHISHLELLVEDDCRELVAPGSVHPRQLALIQQPVGRVRRMHVNSRPALRVALLG